MNASKNRSALFALVVAAALFASCDSSAIRGNHDIVTEQRPISDFTTVTATGAFQVEWKAGPPSVSIITDSNLQDRIIVTNRGEELRLSYHGSIRPTNRLKAVVTSTALTSSKLTGACRLTATHLTGDTFAIETAGASRVNLDGTVTHLLANMTGASNLQAGELMTSTAEMSLTGAARADVTVSDSLHVSIAGAGKVTYGGEPKSIEKSISGAGRVSRRE